MSFRSNSLTRLTSIFMVATLSVTLANCGGGGNVVPLGANSKGAPTTDSCPLVVKTAAIVSPDSTICGGGGGGFTPQTYKLATTNLAGSFSATTTTTTSYTTSGSSTVQSTGDVVATAGSVSSVATNGINTITLTDSKVSAQPMNLQYIDAAYIQPGANTMPGGGTLNMNASSGTATATLTDAKGTTWHLSGSPDADGHHIDIAYTNSAGASGSTTVDGNAVAPAEMATMATDMAHRDSTGHYRTDGGWGTAAKVGAIAACALGVVAAGLTLAAVVTTAPVWVPIAAAGFGLAAAATALGAASADAVDYFQSQKSNGKPT